MSNVLPWHAAPEIENSGSDFTFKSDIYSTGYLFYQITTHQFDLHAENRNIDPNKLFQSDFSHDIHYLIKKMLSHDPSSRPTSDELLQTMQKLMVISIFSTLFA